MQTLELLFLASVWHSLLSPIPLQQVGAVFTMGFCADAPHLLAVGGAMGSVIVWDLRAVQDVVRRFPQLMGAASVPTQ